MKTTIYIAFLRGINVGGHHKVPMADLKQEMAKLQCEHVITILNTGNIIFEAAQEDLGTLQARISTHLEQAFGFPIPTILRTAEMIEDLLRSDPFSDFTLTKEMRFYVSFLRAEPKTDLEIPWQSADQSYIILSQKEKTIVSVLDMSVAKTPKAMEVLERYYGKDITTRNWNTIKRIEKKLAANS